MNIHQQKIKGKQETKKRQRRDKEETKKRQRRDKRQIRDKQETNKRQIRDKQMKKNLLLHAMHTGPELNVTGQWSGHRGREHKQHCIFEDWQATYTQKTS